MPEADSHSVNFKVRLGVWDIYWSILKFLVTPRIALPLLVVIVLSALEDFKDRTFSITLTIIPVVLLVILLTVFLTRGKHMPLDGAMYEISDFGITTDWGNRSSSVRWEWVKDATESNRYIWVRYKVGSLAIPKKQVRDTDLAAVREILREHLKERARVRA